MTETVSKTYWESTHSQPRWRLPSRLNVATRNILRLLAAVTKPGMQVLEIGCAPGKHLAYLAKRRHANVCGLDYSEPGIAFSRELFFRLGLEAVFRCEDVFATTLPDGAFDLVYSLGVIEHFNDPRPLIEKHLRLVKPGGLVLITVPNYGGLYRRLQRHFDPENLAIHNLDVMSCQSLLRMAPKEVACECMAYRMGRLSPWIVHFHKRWPTSLADGVSYTLNLLGLLQPVDIGPLCPLLVLRMRKKAAHGSSGPPGLVVEASGIRKYQRPVVAITNSIGHGVIP